MCAGRARGAGRGPFRARRSRLLVALCAWRPYMGRALNVVYVAVAGMAVVNSALLLLFSNVFGLPVPALDYSMIKN